MTRIYSLCSPHTDSQTLHPEPEVLAALLEADAAADPELAAALEHTDSCPVCQAELTAMRRTEALLASRSLGDASPPARVDTAIYAALGLPIPLRTGNFAVEEVLSRDTPIENVSKLDNIPLRPLAAAAAPVGEAFSRDNRRETRLPQEVQRDQSGKTQANRRRVPAWRTTTFGLARVAALVFAVGLIVAIVLNLSNSAGSSTGTNANAPAAGVATSAPAAATTAPAAGALPLSPTSEIYQNPSSGGAASGVTTAPAVAAATAPAAAAATTAPAMAATTAPAAAATTAPATAATSQNTDTASRAGTSQLAYTDTAANDTRDLKIASFDVNGKIVGTPKTIVTNVSGGEWSPDGLHFAYVQDKKLYVVDPDQAIGTNTVAETLLARDDNGSVPTIRRWSPDSRALLYYYTGGGQGGLFVVDLYGQKRGQITSSYQTATWTRNAKTIIYQTREFDVFAVDVTIGANIALSEPRQLANNILPPAILSTSPNGSLLNIGTFVPPGTTYNVVPIAGGQVTTLKRPNTAAQASIYAGFWHDFNGRIFLDGYEFTADGKLARPESLWPDEAVAAWSGEYVLLVNNKSGQARTAAITATGLQQVAQLGMMARGNIVSNGAKYFIYPQATAQGKILYTVSTTGTTPIPVTLNGTPLATGSDDNLTTFFAPQQGSLIFSVDVPAKGRYIGNIAADGKSASVTPLKQAIPGSTDPQIVGWRP